MNRVASAPSCSAFIHRVALEEVSGHRVLIKSRQGNWGLSACGTTHGASLIQKAPAGPAVSHSESLDPLLCQDTSVSHTCSSRNGNAPPVVQEKQASVVSLLCVGLFPGVPSGPERDI